MSGRKTVPKTVDAELLAELRSVHLQLEGAYQRFDFACAPELIDACIYEISYLKARYSYLLRCIKETTPLSAGSRSDAFCVSCAAASVKGGPACLS